MKFKKKKKASFSYQQRALLLCVTPKTHMTGVIAALSSAAKFVSSRHPSRPADKPLSNRRVGGICSARRRKRKCLRPASRKWRFREWRWPRWPRCRRCPRSLRAYSIIWERLRSMTSGTPWWPTTVSPSVAPRSVLEARPSRPAPCFRPEPDLWPAPGSPTHLSVPGLSCPSAPALQ